jgi:hypothetical protein
MATVMTCPRPPIFLCVYRSAYISSWSAGLCWAEPGPNPHSLLITLSNAPAPPMYLTAISDHVDPTTGCFGHPCRSPCFVTFSNVLDRPACRPTHTVQNVLNVRYAAASAGDERGRQPCIYHDTIRSDCGPFVIWTCLDFHQSFNALDSFWIATQDHTLTAQEVSFLSSLSPL